MRLRAFYARRMTTLPIELLNDAQAGLDDAVALRRAIHLEPELGLELPRTQQKIIDALDGLPVSVRTGEHTTSVVAVMEGERAGPTVLLRGDMDALPMPEDTDLPYASRS